MSAVLSNKIAEAVAIIEEAESNVEIFICATLFSLTKVLTNEKNRLAYDKLTETIKSAISLQAGMNAAKAAAGRMDD
eukprot:12205336-Heterocapsa_arctica.AAC.1